MLKKTISLFMLYLSATMMLGHNCIEHHHHPEHCEPTLTVHPAGSQLESIPTYDCSHFLCLFQHDQNSQLHSLDHKTSYNIPKHHFPAFELVEYLAWAPSPVWIFNNGELNYFLEIYYQQDLFIKFFLRGPPVYLS